MRRLTTHYCGPSFGHWLGQRHFHLALLLILLLLDVAVTYILIEVLGTGRESNLLMAPVLEMRFGYAVAAGLKLVVAALAALISWRVYRSLHADPNHRRTKWHIQKLEAWLWMGLISTAAAVDIIILANATLAP